MLACDMKPAQAHLLTRLATVYRINTFPFIHLNIFHTILNIVAFTPLLERFEHEHGTLTSVALFFGRKTPSSHLLDITRGHNSHVCSPLAFATIPGLIYVFIERFILHANTPVMGASMWVFLLLGMEAIRTYKTNPYFTISTYNIPTWITPLLLVVVTAALLPSSSFLGHLAGLLVGYGCKRFNPNCSPTYVHVEGRKKAIFANMDVKQSA